jgi:serine/threonine protein kinase/tetratricopeptide (TPR) repeat protein
MTPAPDDVQSIFGRALEIESAADRAAYLDKACGTDDSLRGEVEGLLAANGRAGEFMRRPAAAVAAGITAGYEPLTEKPGTRVGPYKLLQQIGEGGMGVVYMAEQEQPVRRKVALKIIKPGMDSMQVVARFEAERQALAMMDHTNIARVFDAGTTESGRPYFVMELVHGVPITEYCDANQLTPRERLELFVPVCHAIQHAHQKGIIHRDIKPSNILVTMYDDKPVPKVIDFGVAKAVEQRLTEKTLFTQYGALVGTLEYMSPEQAEMNAFGVDTRSDIYSLGVLLYELLTGTTPLERARLREAAFGEIVRLIKEEEPPRPSVRLSTSGALAKVAAARRTGPAKLSRLVRGELDWVVMHCLEKDRSRRYETVSALGRDVEQYLRDEPVEARPPTVGYRLRKFARRNRGKVVASAALLLLLVIGLAGTSVGLIRARTEAERALAAERKAKREKENTQATLDFLWQDVLFQASPWLVADRDLKLRDLIDRAAAPLNAGTGRPPLVEATLRRMLGAIYTEIGEPDKGRQFLEAALRVERRELAEDDPELLETEYLYGRCLVLLYRADEAGPILDRNLKLRRRVFGTRTVSTLIVMRWAAVCHAAQGQYEEGDRLFQEGLDVASGMPEYQTICRVLFRYYLSLSQAARGDLKGAEANLKECLAEGQQQGVPKDFPPVLGARRNLAWVYVLQDDLVRAEAPAREAVARMRTVMGARHPYTLNAIWVLARIYLAQGRYDDADKLIEQAVEGSRGRQEEGIVRLAGGLGMRGQLLLAQKKYAEAEPPLRECLELWEKRLPHGGYYFLSLSKRSAAREYAFAKCLLGASLLGQKKYDKAEQLLLDGYDGLKVQPEFPEDATAYAHRSRVDAMTWLMQLYQAWDRPKGAARWRKELEAAKEAAKPAAAP